MPKKGQFFFLFFLFLSISIFLLSKFKFLDLPESFLAKGLTTVTSPVIFLGDFASNLFAKDTKKLKDENLELRKKILDQQRLLEENKALHDQFQVSNPRSLDLLPANVIGKTRFLPGAFLPESFVIDRGTDDGLKVGNAILFKDNLVGEVTKASKFVSLVALIGNSNLQFAAKTQKGAVGIIKGDNGDLFLDNVLLSEKIQKGDLVITSGDFKIDQTGSTPDLIVGEIVTVSGSASDLFQRAKLKTLLDFSKISEVFVLKGIK